MRLRTKFSLAAIVLVGMTLIAAAGGLFVVERQYLLKGAEEEKKNSIKKLVSVCQESYADRNDVLLMNYIKTLSEIPEVKYVAFMDTYNRVLLHSDMKYMNKVFNDDITENAQKSSELLIQDYITSSGADISEVSGPVRYGGEKIGVSRIGYDQEKIKERVESSLRASAERLLIVGGGAMFFGVMGALVLAQTMTRPIRVLEEGARKIGEGKLDYQIPVTRKDELGSLSGEFNLMARKLAELDQMKSDFVSSVSHELRSPLGAITGYVDSMLGGLAGKIPEQFREYLIIIKKNSLRLKNFIDDILDLAKLEAGMFEIRPQEAAFSEIVRDILVLFQPGAEKLGISLRAHINPEGASCKMDADRMRQVFTNLVSNAIKFTPEGGSINVLVADKNDHFLCSVEDSGVGIPKEGLKEVFSKFKQVKDQKSVRKTKGTGLGLSIAKGIVESHGGKIWVESQEGSGTTFFFSIPKTAGTG